MILQNFTDLIDIRLCFRVFRFHGLYLIGRFLENSEKSLFFLLVKVSKFLYYTGKKVPHLSQIFRLHILHCSLRKIRHLFLGSGAILKNHRRIRQINLACELIDCTSLVVR